jgi:hypothetical protein
MKFFKVFKVVMGVAMSIAGESMEAWEDGVLDGPELASIIKKGIMGLRMTGVSQDELDQILLITTKMEYDMLPFKDGDLVIYGPSELTSKLKIKV